MEITLVLTKTETFKLKPYGKFYISQARKPKDEPHVLDFRTLSFDSRTGMPMTLDQEKQFVKEMRKDKTDIYTDGSYNGFYTRIGNTLCQVYHKKLGLYRDNEGFRELVDNR